MFQTLDRRNSMELYYIVSYIILRYIIQFIYKYHYITFYMMQS